MTADALTDSLQRFVFEGAAVRGAIVRLDAAWRAALERREYPDPVAQRARRADGARPRC